MTVAELIDVLKKMPQDAVVRMNTFITGARHVEYTNIVYLEEDD